MGEFFQGVWEVFQEWVLVVKDVNIGEERVVSFFSLGFYLNLFGFNNLVFNKMNIKNWRMLQVVMFF